jgi:phosphoglycolate phosphatase-like HAD superfamily hydrolase
MEKDIRKIIDHARCFDKKEKINILHFLILKNESTIEEISGSLNIRNSTVYKYLMQMMQAGIVAERKLPGKKGKSLFSIEDISFSLDQEKIKNVFGLEKNEKKLIIFDVDDTLFRRTDIPDELSFAGKNAIKEAKRIFQEKGIPVSMPPEELFNADWIHTKYGNAIEWYMRTWLSVAGVPDCDIKETLVKKYVKEYYKNIELSSINCTLFKDVIPFLEKTHSKAYFAAMSNSSKKTIIELFKVNDLLGYFSKDKSLLILGGDEIIKSKEAIQHIIRLVDIDIKNVFVVGDTGGDMKAAIEAGISPNKTYAILRGITPMESLKLIKPKIKIIENLSNIKDI